MIYRYIPAALLTILLISPCKAGKDSESEAEPEQVKQKVVAPQQELKPEDEKGVKGFHILTKDPRMLVLAFLDPYQRTKVRQVCPYFRYLVDHMEAEVEAYKGQIAEVRTCDLDIQPEVVLGRENGEVTLLEVYGNVDMHHAQITFQRILGTTTSKGGPHPIKLMYGLDFTAVLTFQRYVLKDVKDIPNWHPRPSDPMRFATHALALAEEEKQIFTFRIHREKKAAGRKPTILRLYFVFNAAPAPNAPNDHFIGSAALDYPTGVGWGGFKLGAQLGYNDLL